VKREGEKRFRGCYVSSGTVRRIRVRVRGGWASALKKWEEKARGRERRAGVIRGGAENSAFALNSDVFG